MKYLSLLFASVLLSSVSVPVEAAQTDEQPSNDVAQLASHSVWANVNQIKFLEEHVSANSGIMRLKLGETITVKALVTYSGDIQPILQSVVQFENVDPALKIEHDPSSLVFHNKLATFTFNITLTQPINRPALFSVKVADGQPGDRHHLTPYSQCQTVEQKAGGTGGVTDPDPNPNPKPDNPDENPDETPDNPDENPDVTPDNPDENPVVTPDNPDENPDVTPDNPDENPDEIPDNPDENPDVTPDNPDGNPDVTPDNPDENPDAKPDKPEGNNGNYEGDNEEDGNGGHGGEEVIKPQIHPEGSNPTITIPEQVKPLSQIRKQSIPSVGTTDVLVNKKSSENAKEILPMTKIAHSSNQAANYKNSSTATEEATKQLPKTGEHNRFFTWIFGLLITGMSMVTFRKIN
ncbi:LPXTG cell wall anchor domain-containing protein [Enterococcus mundtii]|uniref:LPXTG cell wall anchor domain-containing protein n=1 Tax=Enterococcus mundtii TaxID=53346 RepID=UPI001369A398|nr:LPXTG cell wall anchor domain-containing protein [Enterococcus mundtii]MZZ60440.1 LPXTG cell wall anchor domain-containing protein [Enterococcus mundtii]MZZ96276.1 LPXTG cell wall anchor domain-containing protein [Enterococcus mundtii]NAA73450.1 LPXTG cell wall anchor domain-containing protein [Enterococcus mundtii]NAA92818.1 LPXTG cell wall anchor domain-containing protein [Enterococcus mundtii]